MRSFPLWGIVDLSSRRDLDYSYTSSMEVLKIDAARRGTRRTTRHTALVAAVVVILCVLSAPSAASHNSIESTTPADGAKLRSAPDRVEITFNQEVSSGYARVVVRNPQGMEYQVGKPTLDGRRVVQPLAPLPADRYVISIRTVSADGHPAADSFGFSLVESAATSSTAVTPIPSASTGPDPLSGHHDIVREGGDNENEFLIFWAFAAILSLGIAAALTVARRRRFDEKS